MAWPGLGILFGATKPPWTFAWREGNQQRRQKLGFAWTDNGEPPPGWLTVLDARKEANRIKKAARKGEVIDKPERAPRFTAAAPTGIILEDAIQHYLDVKQPKSRAAVERLLAHDLGPLEAGPALDGET